MSNKKLSVALGLREKTEKDFNNMLADMASKFKNKQGIFKGVRNEFTALEGHPDMPEKRKTELVASTVDEQLGWLKEHSLDYLNTVFSIERTNALGVKAPLVVAGQNWGEYTTLELLRLKGILDGKLKALIQDIPIRSEGERWKITTDPVYDGRQVFENDQFTGRTKTTIKRTVVVDDPLQREIPTITRTPVTQVIDTPVETGEFKEQKFSGEWTNRQRAQLEVTYNAIYKAVIEALETANNVNMEDSDLGDKVLNYLFK